MERNATVDIGSIMSRLAVLRNLDIPDDDDYDSSKSRDNSSIWESNSPISKTSFRETKETNDEEEDNEDSNKENEKIFKLEIENKKLREELQNLKRRSLTSTSNKENLQRVTEISLLKRENLNLKQTIKRLEDEKDQLGNKVEKQKQLLSKFELVEINMKKYQLICKIGSGGFSEVFKCISIDTKESVALKKVTINDKESAQLIKNEIDLLIKLKDSNKVVNLIDHQYLPEKSTFFVVMELGNLDLQVFFKKEIQSKGHIEEPGRVYYWVKMLEAVKAIHDHGIIHSDLKPSNFLLVGHEVKLIDFNISNEINDRTSMTVQNDCGTLFYMAPESISQESQRGKISFKTDVWSLGCILYYMTYGRLPFQHVKNQFQLFMQLTNPDKQIKFAPLIDQDLMDVLINALRHHQKERYSIQELLNHKYVKSKL